jgi:hypothetical protein
VIDLLLRIGQTDGFFYVAQAFMPGISRPFQPSIARLGAEAGFGKPRERGCYVDVSSPDPGINARAT